MTEVSGLHNRSREDLCLEKLAQVQADVAADFTKNVIEPRQEIWDSFANELLARSPVGIGGRFTNGLLSSVLTGWQVERAATSPTRIPVTVATTVKLVSTTLAPFWKADINHVRAGWRLTYLDPNQKLSTPQKAGRHIAR